MAGDTHEPYDDPKLKGLSRYFNGKTIKGRANVAMATIGGLFAFFIYKKFIVHILPEHIIPERKCPPCDK